MFVVLLAKRSTSLETWKKKRNSGFIHEFMCAGKKLKAQECGKGHGNNSSSVEGARRRRAANIRCAVDSTLRPGEPRIDVMRITYPEQSQVLHLTDALSTLGIHKRGGSHEGQRDAFNYVPKNGWPSYL